MPEAITVNDIDGSFIPRPRRDLVDLEIGLERVLLGPDPYALNGTAALIWQCFDGEGTLEELVSDLSAACGVDQTTIRTDVMALTRDLGSLGMLDGVVPNRHATGKSSVAAAGIGDELEAFCLQDLDGVERNSESFRGQRVLLVNWNPGCGFCARIAPEIAALQQPLRENDVSLVFLTKGGANDNRTLFKKYGIDSPALLGGPGGPFGKLGTPAAYLLDESGRVAAPLAYGAVAVPQLLRETAGVDAESEYAVSRYLPTKAVPVCGGGGSDDGDGMTWTGTAAYRFGEVHVGIRHNTASTAELLDRLFSGRRVEDSRVPDNYSVVLRETRDRGQDFNLLLEGPKYLVRSRTRARVLHGLLGHLSAELCLPEAPLLGLRTAAVVRDGRAIVMPAMVTSWFSVLQPRLNRLGLQLVDLPWLPIDPTAAELVVSEPTVEHDRSVLDELDGAENVGTELSRVVPGRYPISAWLVPTRTDAAAPTAARALVEAVPLLVLPPNSGLEEAARLLVRMFEKVDLVGAWLDRPATVTEVLEQLG
jgi:thiol-disulfide isomerase/thioredoxin